jgi:hypothetical protein
MRNEFIFSTQRTWKMIISMETSKKFDNLFYLCCLCAFLIECNKTMKYEKKKGTK